MTWRGRITPVGPLFESPIPDTGAAGDVVSAGGVWRQVGSGDPNVRPIPGRPDARNQPSADIVPPTEVHGAAANASGADTGLRR